MWEYLVLQLWAVRAFLLFNLLTNVMLVKKGSKYTYFMGLYCQTKNKWDETVGHAAGAIPK
jgi:hypothetical protein